MSDPDWWQKWSAFPVVIVASGPSAKNVPLNLLQGFAKFIAINESWALCPWADVLYGADANWWKHKNGVPEFAGLKISQDARACAAFSDIRRVYLENISQTGDVLKLSENGKLGAGGNSGFQAFNLAIQFGAGTILLVGFDMRIDRGLHWHGKHAKLSNPNERVMIRWRKAFDAAARITNAMGIKVINCSLDSQLTGFPKMTFDQAARETLQELVERSEYSIAAYDMVNEDKCPRPIPLGECKDV